MVMHVVHHFSLNTCDHSWPDVVLERSAQQLFISPGPEALWAWPPHKLPGCFKQHGSHESPRADTGVCGTVPWPLSG